MRLAEFARLKLAVWVRALPMAGAVVLVLGGRGGAAGSTAAVLLAAVGAWLLWRFWSSYGG